jgi:hypothetical protein
MSVILSPFAALRVNSAKNTRSWTRHLGDLRGPNLTPAHSGLKAEHLWVIIS